MKIVITGATGQIGSKLIKNLDLANNEIVLITRNRSKLVGAEQQGATVLEGDMLDAEFMHNALNGADTYFFLPPPNFQSADMVEEYRELATVSRDAARAAGVERILHLSTLGGHLDLEETGLIRGQHHAEVLIRDGAPNVLHLRCGFFLENYLGSVATIAHHGGMYFPVSQDSKYPFVSASDIATIVKELLETPTWVGNRIIEFQGPGDYSFGEVAAQFSEGIGMGVNHVAVPPEAAIEAMMGMGMSKAYASDLTKIFTSIESGVLRPEFGREDSRVRQTGMTPLDFAKNVLKPAVDAARSQTTA